MRRARDARPTTHHKPRAIHLHAATLIPTRIRPTQLRYDHTPVLKDEHNAQTPRPPASPCTMLGTRQALPADNRYPSTPTFVSKLPLCPPGYPQHAPRRTDTALSFSSVGSDARPRALDARIEKHDAWHTDATVQVPVQQSIAQGRSEGVADLASRLLRQGLAPGRGYYQGSQIYRGQSDSGGAG